jgi:hypothetical protein
MLKMTWKRCVLLALFFFPMLLQPQSSKAVWEIELSNFGYQGRPPAALQHLSPALQPFAGWAYQQGVAFTDSKTVVVYFVVHDDPPGSAEHRDPALSDPFRLVAIFLNADNGKLVKKLDWPLPANPRAVPPSFFFPATRGQFIVALGNRLNLYSSDFKLLAHLDGQSDLDPIASPTGRSLLLSTVNQVDGQWTTRYELVDTTNLSELKTWSEAASVPPHSIQAVWDDELAWPSRSSLYLQAPALSPKQLFANQGELCGVWGFIGKEELAGPTCGAANRLLTVSTQGSVVWDFDLGFEQLDGPAVASANGQRFAIPTFRWGSGKNDAPDQLTARAFGLKSKTPLLTLNVPRNFGAGQNYFYNSYGDTRFGWGGLALSPEGDLLAVKSGANVAMYRVPEIATSSKCGTNCKSQTERANPQPSPPAASTVATTVPRPSAQLIGQMLAWFPTDTETVTAVTGPFLLPKMEKDSNGTLSMVHSEHEVRDKFMQLPLLPLFALGKNLEDEPIVAAIEGSRDYLPPSGLGMMKSQGALIAVFAGDITDRAHSYLKDSAATIVRTVQIAGHAVAVFEGKSEEDLWTTYIAFPKPNIVVAATNEDYLREVLARIDGKHGERALPDSLPEWKHVNTDAQFWAVRHYRKRGTETDPTSPFNGAWGKPSDPQAIGLTFHFDPDQSKTATITYLSGDENSLQRFKKQYFTERGPAVTQMHIQYREGEPGALEGSYDVEQMESANYFVFVLEALLGHAIYV